MDNIRENTSLEQNKPVHEFKLNFSSGSLMAILFVIITHGFYSFIFAILIREELKISTRGDYTWLFLLGALLLFFYSMVNLQRIFIVSPDKNKIKKFLNSGKDPMPDGGPGTVNPIFGFYPRNYLKAPHVYFFPFVLYVAFWSLLVLFYLLFLYSDEIGTSAETSGIIFSIIMILGVGILGLFVPIRQYLLCSSMIEIYKKGFVFRNGFRTTYFPITGLKEVVQWSTVDGISNLTFIDMDSIAHNLNVTGLVYSDRKKLEKDLTEFLENTDIDFTDKFKSKTPANRVIINSRKIKHPSGSIRGRTGRW